MAKETTGQEAVPIVVQLAQLARSDVPGDQFLKEFFRLVHTAMAAQGGSLWLYDSANRQLTPKVAYSPDGGPLSTLSEEDVTKLVYRTVEQKQPVLYYPEMTKQGGQSEQAAGPDNVCLVAVPTELDDKVQAVLLLARRNGETPPYRREDVHLVQSLCVYIVAYFANLRLRQAAASAQRLAVLADVESDLGAAVEREKMAFILANRVREMMFFDRTFVALPRRSGFRIAAVSGVDDVSQQTAAVVILRDLVREVLRIGGDWHFTPSYLEKVEDELLREKIAAYFEMTEYKSVLIMRVEDDEGVLAVIGFERRAEGTFGGGDFAFLQGFAKASAKALRRAVEFDSMPGIRLVKRLSGIRRQALGPKRSRFFIKVAVLLAVVAFLVFGRWNLDVGGRCQIVPHVTAFAAPRYSGTIVDILKNEGEAVASGEVIAVMDDRDIKKRIGEINLQVTGKELERDARLSVNPAAAALVQVEIDILKTRLESLQLQLENLNVRSPIDGVIVTQRDQMNAQVNSVKSAGEPICRIADASKLYLEVQIDERDIRFVEEGQVIRFALAGAPGITHTCTVVEISPMTTALPGKNVFLVRGELRGASEGAAFRMGSTGSASIHTGRRQVLYVLMRSTFERLRSVLLWLRTNFL